MKALVLSGGKGTRLRPFTYTGAKQLVPLANKPVLFYVLEDIVAAGITDIGIIVGDTADQIREAVGDGGDFGASVTYIPQDRPAGLAHALTTARGFLENQRFVMYLGDNFIQHGIERFVRDFANSSNNAAILVYEVADPGQFGVAEIDNGRLVGFVEKPKSPRSNLAVIGIYFFDHHILDAAGRVTPSWRGELEIGDAVMELLGAGFDVGVHQVDGWWIDTGGVSDMLDANRLVLQDLVPRVLGTISADSTVQGKVVVEQGATVRGSTLRGPLIVGAGAMINASYIGPYTAIGANCVVERSEVQHSIVMEGTRIVGVPHRIDDSLVGRDVTVTSSTLRPTACRLTLGDHSQVVLP